MSLLNRSSTPFRNNNKSCKSYKKYIFFFCMSSKYSIIRPGFYQSRLIPITVKLSNKTGFLYSLAST